MSSPARQSGFTLVEVAAVMVIAGLLFGSVLKNRELVESATAKRLANDFRAVGVALTTYHGIYRALPGDDPAAPGHTGGVLATTPMGAVGNFRVDGDWNSLNATDESYLIWQHLRLARLLDGQTAVPAAPAVGDGYTPRNGVDGRLGLTSNAVLTAGPWPATHFICASGIPGRQVRRLEHLIDDGNTLTGSLRTLCQGECSAGSGVSVTLANESATFTVCSAS
jgi:prepilin-type N-terminal cleavage/methylation domain-containing protein